jgi:hypothetical protein
MNKSTGNYQRTFEQLEQVASKFWPAELSEIEAQLSIIPLLLQTQDDFVSLLSVNPREFEKLFEFVAFSSLPANLFLKHLVILADFGGEMLKRVSREFEMLFPEGKLNYEWHGEQRSYAFKALPNRKFSNPALKIDGKHLLQDHPLDDLTKDAIMLLLFGSAYSGGDANVAATLARCEIGEYLGKPGELARFIKQRYIWVSRVTRGAKANSLGQIAQNFVAQYLTDNLRLPGLEIKAGGRLPGVTHTDTTTGRATAFDLVVTDSVKHVAIEVSFQVTTNSTIERKAGQARARYEQAGAAGHRIAYVIDGSGNFERETAMRTICAHSHCTVAFSRSELGVLCSFLSEFFAGTGN